MYYNCREAERQEAMEENRLDELRDRLDEHGLLGSAEFDWYCLINVRGRRAFEGQLAHWERVLERVGIHDMDLETLIDLQNKTARKKWGFPIFRTVYGPDSDAKFKIAMTVFDDWVLTGLRTRDPSYEVERHAAILETGYSNRIHEGQNLDGADRCYLNGAFLRSLASVEEGRFVDRAIRYNLGDIVYITIDEASLDSLVQHAGSILTPALGEGIGIRSRGTHDSPKVSMTYWKTGAVRSVSVMQLWTQWINHQTELMIRIA